MSSLPSPQEFVSVSLDVVWQDPAGKQDARMSEISMDGCFIDSYVPTCDTSTLSTIR